MGRARIEGRFAEAYAPHLWQGTCAVCQCTDDRACMVGGDPCEWRARDLCSACVERVCGIGSSAASLYFKGMRITSGHGEGTRAAVDLYVEFPQGTRVARQRVPLRLDLYAHSPDGFEWGYGGSGPSQLGIAIAAVLFGDELALRLGRMVTSRVVRHLPGEAWTLDARQIERCVEQDVDLSLAGRS